jgi:hypothetical protein
VSASEGFSRTSSTSWHRAATIIFVLLLAGCLSEYIVGDAVSEDCPGVDLSSDPDNCSACGVPCPEGEACIGGSCGSDCDDGQQVCQRLCVDVQSNALHCGDCDSPCPAGEACVAGSCVDTCNGSCDPTIQLCSDGRCVCRLGLNLCNGACVDRRVAPQDCGECTVRCNGSVCASGVCVPSCPDTLTECPDDACTDLAIDPLHCGACDRTCTANEVCVAGDCEEYLPAPCAACPCPECGDRMCCPTASGPACVEGGGCPQ